MRDIAKLLPTTRAQNGEDRNNKIYARDPSQPQNLENALAVTLMPTPMSRDWKGDTAPHERDGVVQTDSVERAIFHSGEVLLGTPRNSSANGSSSKQVAAGAPKSRLEDQVLMDAIPEQSEEASMKMFPTLRASDGYERRNQKTMDKIAREGGDMTMPTLARTTTNWGKFEPAIRRWEQTLGRPAPAPTKPDGKDGNHRLSSAFTEWMMGLPSGWITEVGLSRNDELKACGNGVVPQQAELALRALLGNSELNKLQDNASLLPTVMANSPMRNSRRSMVTHPTKRSGVALNQALELISGVLPAEFESWDEVPANYQDMNQTEGITMRGKRLKR